jgi:hypothetical protein
MKDALTDNLYLNMPIIRGANTIISKLTPTNVAKDFFYHQTIKVGYSSIIWVGRFNS